MKLIIAGSRYLEVTLNTLDRYMYRFKLYNIKEIVSGAAMGVDRSGEQWAVNKVGIFLTKIEADWDSYGKAAGPIRNRQMAEYAEALLLIWDGESKGSFNMKQEMINLGKPIYEVIIKETYEATN